MTPWPALGGNRLPGYPNYIYIYIHISWLPQPSHDFFQAHEGFHLMWIPLHTTEYLQKATWKSQPWFSCRELGVQNGYGSKFVYPVPRKPEILSIDELKILKTSIWKHPSWGSMLLIHRQMHFTTDALTRPKVNKITAMLPNQTNLGVSRQNGTCKGEWFI